MSNSGNQVAYPAFLIYWVLNLSKKITVVGFGNILKRDDGIGIIVLESLLKYYEREGIDYFNLGIVSFDLINRLYDYDAALLIDGINASLAVGEVKIFELRESKYNFKVPVVSTHELSLSSIFELSKKFKLKTKIYVAGIQVGDTAFGGLLTKCLEDKLEEIIGEISVFIDENLLL